MLENFLERVSVRDFQNYQLTPTEIDQIKAVINATPTSTNLVQYSAILVTDQKRLNKIATAVSQKHVQTGSGFIIFLGDRTRILKEKQSVQSQTFLFHDYFRAIQDASIAGGIVNSALIEMGFGTTFIGNVQVGGAELEQFFQIPSSAFFVLGIVFGKAAHKNAIKPKLNRFFLNSYDVEQAKRDYETYHETTKSYFASINHQPYAQQVASFINPNQMWKDNFELVGHYLQKKSEEFK